MESREISRRNFSLFTASALGGALAGSVLLSSVGAEEEAKKDANSCSGKDGCTGKGSNADMEKMAEMMMGDSHLCCGLNACKGKGGDGKNECAGLGNCATMEKHECKGHNTCKGKGGCGTTAMMNECKGKGECSVPIKSDDWEKARMMFEKVMRHAGKGYSFNPETCKSMMKM